MILIRIAYSANLPTVKEILDNVKKNSSLAPQATTESQKKNNLNFASNENQQNQSFNKMEDIVSYLEENKKILMAYSLKNNISVEDFKDGYISMIIDDSIKSDFILSLQKILQETTNKVWKIDVKRGVLGETLAYKENAQKEEEKKNVSEYPLVKAILAEFRGAKIETVSRIIINNETSEEEAQMPIESDIYFDDDM